MKKIGVRIYLYEKDELIKRSHMFMKTGRKASRCVDSFISVYLQTPAYSERNGRSDFLSILFPCACMMRM